MSEGIESITLKNLIKNVNTCTFENTFKDKISYLLPIVTFSMYKNLANFDSLAACSQRILHAFTTNKVQRKSWDIHTYWSNGQQKSLFTKNIKQIQGIDNVNARQ